MFLVKDAPTLSPPKKIEEKKIEEAKKLTYKAKRKPLFRKYPFIRQYDASDCGAASLAMICKFYGKEVSISWLRDLANVNTQGASLLSMAKAAEHLGFISKAIKTDYKSLHRVILPAIIHWGGESLHCPLQSAKRQSYCSRPR